MLAQIRSRLRLPTPATRAPTIAESFQL